MYQKQNEYGKGFTLPEILVALCLFTLFSTFCIQGISNISAQQQKRMALLELKENLRLAVGQMTDDAVKSTAVLHCEEKEMALQQTNGIYYTMGKDLQSEEHFYPLTGKILYRRESNQWNRQPVANFLTDLSIIYYDIDGNETKQPENVVSLKITAIGCWEEQFWKETRVASLAGEHYI